MKLIIVFLVSFGNITFAQIQDTVFLEEIHIEKSIRKKPKIKKVKWKDGNDGSYGEMSKIRQYISLVSEVPTGVLKNVRFDFNRFFTTGKTLKELRERLQPMDYKLDFYQVNSDNTIGERINEESFYFTVTKETKNFFDVDVSFQKVPVSDKVFVSLTRMKPYQENEVFLLGDDGGEKYLSYIKIEKGYEKSNFVREKQKMEITVDGEQSTWYWYKTSIKMILEIEVL